MIKKIRLAGVRMALAAIVGALFFYFVWRRQNANVVHGIAVNRAEKDALDQNRNDTEWAKQVTVRKIKEKTYDIENLSKAEVIESFNQAFGLPPSVNVVPNRGAPGVREPPDVTIP
jgi:hypothetical protein